MQNPCSWLVKSQTTESYDLIHVGKENHWFVWKGLIESNQKVSIECNGCRDNSDCNYNGECLGRECVCNEGYFGALCQFTKPCNVVRCEWLVIDICFSLSCANWFWYILSTSVPTILDSWKGWKHDTPIIPPYYWRQWSICRILWKTNVRSAQHVWDALQSPSSWFSRKWLRGLWDWIS